MERSGKFSRQLNICSAPYYELNTKLQHIGKQSLYTYFFITKPAEVCHDNSTNDVQDISSDDDAWPLLNKEHLGNIIFSFSMWCENCIKQCFFGT